MKALLKDSRVVFSASLLAFLAIAMLILLWLTTKLDDLLCNSFTNIGVQYGIGWGCLILRTILTGLALYAAMRASLRLANRLDTQADGLSDFFAPFFALLTVAIILTVAMVMMKKLDTLQKSAEILEFVYGDDISAGVASAKLDCIARAVVYGVGLALSGVLMIPVTRKRFERFNASNR